MKYVKHIVQEIVMLHYIALKNVYVSPTAPSGYTCRARLEIGFGIYGMGGWFSDQSQN